MSSIPHPYSGFYPFSAFLPLHSTSLQSSFEPLLTSTPLMGRNQLQGTVGSYVFPGLSEPLSAPAPALNAVGWPILGAAGGAAAASACVAAPPPPTRDEIATMTKILAHLATNQMEIFEDIVRSVGNLQEFAVKCAQLMMNVYSFSSAQSVSVSLQNPFENGISCIHQPEYSMQSDRQQQDNWSAERVVQELERLVESESESSGEDTTSPASESIDIEVQDRMMRELEMLVSSDDLIDVMQEEQPLMWWEEESPPPPLNRWQRICLESEDYLDESPSSDEESELAELLSLDGEESWESLPTDETQYWRSPPSSELHLSLPPYAYRSNRYRNQLQNSGAAAGNSSNNRSVYWRFQETNRMQTLTEDD